jgi:hypothetical protein
MMVGNEMTGPVAGVGYKADSALEAEIVAHCRKALEQSDKSSWDVADDYHKLSKCGWTQQRIAEEFGTNQSSVFKFIACAKNSSVPNIRPRFWEAFQDVNSESKPEVLTNWADKQCNTVEWRTPSEILEPVRDYFGGCIPLDPAAPSDNPTGAERFFTKDDDGLAHYWAGNGVFVIPPYGSDYGDLWRKIHADASKGLQIIALLPCGARFISGYWLSKHWTAMCFVPGRVGLVNESGEQQKGNPYDSILYGFNVDYEAFTRSFSSLGTVSPGPAHILLAEADEGRPAERWYAVAIKK